MLKIKDKTKQKRGKFGLKKGEFTKRFPTKGYYHEKVS